MKKTYEKSLFLFRRDLRLEDNTGLIYALNHSVRVIPVFIFTPEQIEHNPYRSDHCLQFMIESLQSLHRDLKKKKSKLFLFKGHPENILSKCISKLKIDALIVNRDYTPFSIERDKKLEKICKKNGIDFHSFDDALLHPPETTLKKDGNPYTIFTPYFRNASKMSVSFPVHNPGNGYFQGSIAFAENESFLSKLLPKKQNANQIKGGREHALDIIKNLSHFTKYAKLRDFPESDYSTHLSPYLKFTVCSPREIYHAICSKLNSHHELIRSLYWRDFFTSIAFYFPHVFKGSFHRKFDQIPWSNDKKKFKNWCDGLTGFPIVDAGMRELNQTGFMHNRVRMIAASLLVKDLHIHWRWGEKYFAQTLIDYDPAVNNGNWQWVASVGCDAQPYFRIFNPWTQQKKFDPECIYIKKWIHELADTPVKVIHSWKDKKYWNQYPSYPQPMVDHEIEAKQALRFYKISRNEK